jgi:hypothetical protein
MCIITCAMQARGETERRRRYQWMTLQMSAVSDAAAHNLGPRGAKGARDGSRDTCEPIMSTVRAEHAGGENLSEKNGE